MTDASRKRRLPNPFYVLVVVIGTLFVITCLAWLVLPVTGGEPGGAGNGVLINSFGRLAPKALAFQCVALVAAGLLAMATDRWFDARK